MDHQYKVRGSVRGTIYDGRSETAALRAIAKDRRDCRNLGGGAYSDVQLYCDGELVDSAEDES